MRLLTLALAASLAACSSASDGPVTEAGSLDASDRTLQSGEYFDQYRVTASEDQWIRVEVTAEAFDPYLIVRSPSGVQSDVDDSESGNTTTTTSVIRASEGGRWDVIVTSYAPGGTGSYSVTYEVTDVMPEGAAPRGPDSTIAA